MRIYIAGPMTGKPSLNFPAFHATASQLREMGHEAVNPAEICPDPGMSWAACMRADLAQLLTCDAIVMLDGWMHSRGAALEHYLAVSLGLRVIFEPELALLEVPA